MKFGIEIEAVGLTLDGVAQLLSTNGVACINAGYTHRVVSTWKVVTDASVRGGFELVSPPLEYNEENIELVRRVIELLNEAGCSVDARCGLHVHFEVSQLSPEHVANIFNRYRKFENDFDLMMPNSRRRSNNGMCRSITTLPTCIARQSLRETCGQYTDRYRKLNMTSFIKYGTIEFRHHSGSLNKAKIANWLRLLNQFIEASRPVVVEQQAIDLSIKGKSRRIIDMLTTAGSNGMNPETLAEILGMTKASVQSAVCRLRRNNGMHISTGQRYVLLTATPVVENAVDTFWKGISSSVKTFYERRIANLNGTAA